MRITVAFRLSSYVTLALACTCLCEAEQSFLPFSFVLMAPVLVLFGVAFVTEGRWQLSNRAANWVGGTIVVVAVVWLTFLYQYDGAGIFREVLPFPVGMLPYTGPVLLAAIAAQVFRPKTIANLWLAQLLGFLIVALGCALASESLFGLLLLAYAVSAVLCLCLFNLQRDAAGPNVLNPLEEWTSPIRPWRRVVVWPMVWMTGIILGLAALLFLLTPRHGNTDWQLGLRGMRGLSSGLGDGSVDLMRSGRIQLNTEVVMEVYARNADGTAKTDFDAFQRWRCTTLSRYHEGRWPRERLPSRGTPEPSQPNLGPNQYTLTYHLRRQRLLALYLAEPLQTHEARKVPLVPLWLSSGKAVWVQLIDGTLIPLEDPADGQFRYQQVLVATDEPHLHSPLPSLPPYPEDNLARYLQMPPNLRIGEWTDQVLANLVKAGVLTEANLQRDTDNHLVSLHREKVARALENYLGNSGGYSYSLDIDRQDSSLDPTEDFLFNIKKGHCELFASALVLMLRSQGIPARIVMGFAGAEHLGNGHYEVRRSHAHSWVEARIDRGIAERPDEYWLTLDPTPAVPAESDAGFILGDWWLSRWKQSRFVWRDFIVEYNAERQEQGAADLAALLRLQATSHDKSSPLSQPWVWVLLGTVAMGLAAVWLLRRRIRPLAGGSRSPHAMATSLYERLLVVLARHRSLRPHASQTPLEFGLLVERELRAAPATALVAAIPLGIVRLYYRVRYGQQRLTDDDRRVVDAQIQCLNEVLATKVAPART